MDSIYCHNNWANGLGGISLPLLADFHPKGAVAQSYGLYLEGAGITDRATVIMDTSGTVRHVSSVTPGGERDIAALAALCEGVDREWPTTLPAIGKGPGLEPGTVLYVKSRCMFSTNALSARHNLHLDDVLPVRNVTEDPSAMADLARLGGKTQAPCLVIGGKALYESADIQKYLAARVVGW